MADREQSHVLDLRQFSCLCDYGQATLLPKWWELMCRGHSFLLLVLSS